MRFKTKLDLFYARNGLKKKNLIREKREHFEKGAKMTIFGHSAKPIVRQNGQIWSIWGLK